MGKKATERKKRIDTFKIEKGITPEFMIKRKEHIAERRLKREENLKLIHEKHIEISLSKRKAEQQPKQTNLVSVHTGLEDTPSLKYCNRLKKNPTEAELKVRRYLKKLHKKFVEQMPIKNDFSFYIVDFYIPKYRLCIEIDGGYHTTDIQQWRDNKRDEFLNTKGYAVLRLTNEEVFRSTFVEFKAKLGQVCNH